MLIALVTLLLLQGGGGGLDIFDKDARKLAQEIIVDDVRAKAVVAEMKSTHRTLNGINKEIGKLFKSWEKTDKSSGSHRADLESKLREAETLRSEAMRSFTDSIFYLRDHMTAEEWHALHQAPADGG